MPLIDVNNDAVIKFAAKLERVNRSAFPSAVRNTLNNAAFEMKKEIPLSAKSKFITRQPTFFRRFSIVDKASGFDVNSMQAITGIDASKNRELAENLVAQEFGGVVRGKKLIPHDNARISNSQSKRVKVKNRHNRVRIHNATSAFKSHRGSKSSKFVAAVMSTAKSGKRHMMLRSGGRGMVYELQSVSQNRRSRKMNFKLTKLYSFSTKKNHSVRSRGFMADAANVASKKMDEFFVKNAEYQLNKALK